MGVGQSKGWLRAVGVALAAGMLAGAVGAAPVVRATGSSTVQHLVMMPNEADIEARAAVDLQLTASNSGKGLMALAQGQTEIALISAPLRDELARLAKLGQRTLREAELRTEMLGEARLEFIVPAAWPVRHLSREQLKSLWSGQVRNWRELGGPDVPVVLVSELPSGAIRTLVVDDLLDGRELPAHARVVDTAPQIGPVVARTPGAIGFASAAARPADMAGTHALQIEGLDLHQTFALVTRAQPSAEVQRVLEAVKNLTVAQLARCWLQQQAQPADPSGAAYRGCWEIDKP